MSISLKRKKIFQKDKRHSSVFLKAFQIGTNYFSFHRHFKEENTPRHKGWLSLFAICESKQDERIVHLHKDRICFLHILCQ